MDTPIRDKSFSLDFVTHLHSYVNENIRFADAKASILITWNLALFGGIVGTQAFTVLASEWLVRIALIGLAFSAAFAFFTVGPRMRIKNDHGLIYWGNVIEHQSPSSFCKAVLETDDDLLLNALIEHQYFMSAIASRKFYWLNIAMFLTIFSSSVLATFAFIRWIG